MTDHNGVLMMQRALLAGTLGLAMARKAAAILEGDPRGGPRTGGRRTTGAGTARCCGRSWTRRTSASGTSTTGPPAERWCDTLFHLLDLAAFATELGGHG